MHNKPPKYWKKRKTVCLEAENRKKDVAFKRNDTFHTQDSSAEIVVISFCLKH